MKQAMNRRINELSETIDQRIQEEIGAYAREQGFDLVLTDGVGFAHPRLDITDAILQRVNAHAAELRGQ
jgi:outer membrane protein